MSESTVLLLHDKVKGMIEVFLYTSMYHSPAKETCSCSNTVNRETSAHLLSSVDRAEVGLPRGCTNNLLEILDVWIEGN